MGCSYQNCARAQVDKYSNKNDGISIQIKNFISQNIETMKLHYKAGRKIGEGKLGKVFSVTHLLTNTRRAMKIINIEKIREVSRVNQYNQPIDNEIDILSICDHPNIQKIYEYFNDGKFFYIILEYVKGKNIYQFISEKEYIHESIVVNIFKQIISVITYLHQNGIIYCNINPDNIIIINDNHDIKFIDFSLSKKLQNNEMLSHNYNEDTQYLAPEVLNESYGFPSDIYSCGVLLLRMMMGMCSSSATQYSKLEQWKSLSPNLRDLLEKMLQSKQSKRIKAGEILTHPWVKLAENPLNSDNNNFKLKINTPSLSQEKLRQATQAYIVHQLDNNKLVDKLRQKFRLYDISGEGLISRDELKKMINNSEENFTELEINDLMDKIDQDHSGSISFEEFLRVMIDYNTLITKENLENAFKFFDKDKSGFLNVEEIKHIFSTNNSEEKKLEKYIENLLLSYDKDKDGQLSLQEFIHLVTI